MHSARGHGHGAFLSGAARGLGIARTVVTPRQSFKSSAPRSRSSNFSRRHDDLTHAVAGGRSNFNLPGSTDRQHCPRALVVGKNRTTMPR